MHPRNRDRDGYDFRALRRSSPGLAGFIVPHPCGGDTINFSDAAAVTALNGALLKLHYGIEHWEIPPGYLCPAVPGRADYVHHVADLLASDASGIPRGSSIRVLDVGVGANCVYPIIGVREYGWGFVGTEIDPVAARSAQKIVSAHAALAANVQIRVQSQPQQIFRGVVMPDDHFAVSMCNPPFHASEASATAETMRKLRNLGSPTSGGPRLNFGGRSHELWCAGGETGLIQRMVRESATLPQLCAWFTTLVSRSGSLPAIHGLLEKLKPADVRNIRMGQGQKQSRIVAWTFLNPDERRHRLASATSDASHRAKAEP